VKRTLLLIAMMMVTMASGCSSFRNGEPANQAGSLKEGLNAVFHTFSDIPVPKELSLVREKSFIYETPGMKVGVLLLSGNVDVASLENYFRVNMAKNGWRFVNSYKYNDMILNFVKDDRASNIRTTREMFTTQVEIWVGPVERNERGTANIGSKFNDSH
jgi:hypothetical protein